METFSHMVVTLPIALGLFLLAAVLVVSSGVFLAKSGDVIADESGLGHVWVGSLLVAGATSLPELVTNVSAVRLDAPSLAAGNIFGANMLNMAPGIGADARTPGVVVVDHCGVARSSVEER